MELPNKRPKLSPAEDDFVALGGGNEDEQLAGQYGYNTSNGLAVHDTSTAPTGPRAMQQHSTHHNQNHGVWRDPRNAKDRPKSKRLLPGFEPWILVHTKYGRRFVHNPDTRESFWHIPPHILPAVREYDLREQEQKEKEANAKWAEEQLQEMRQGSQAEKVNQAADKDPRNRRRRSESLQREDEQAMMAELAADAERAEEQDVKDVVETLEPLKPIAQQGSNGYNSDSSYEEVEVTDSEFEEDDDQVQDRAGARDTQQEDGPVEFGEDDIAYQLAAMDEYDDPDPEEYGSEADEEGEDDPDDQALTQEDATNLFRDMLDDHHISPFTPWDNIIADESDTGIIMDDRYTVLPNMRTRKEVWEAWVKDTAARLKEERAQMEKLDPRIPYLAFLAEKATPKLYWPEFKRKFKKESEMNDRKLGDKDREKLYRAHINRLKLAESTRKADLVALLETVPLRQMHRGTSVDALPSQILSHLHFISLSPPLRDEIIVRHISGLPFPPDDSGDDEVDGAQRAEEDKKREERRRREKALADRERKVDEERRQAEKQERWAKRDLREEEQELRKALNVGRGGIKAHLGDDE